MMSQKVGDINLWDLLEELGETIEWFDSTREHF